MRLKFFLLFCVSLIPDILTKRYEKCDLVKELMTKHKIRDKKDAAAFACLAYELSRCDTTYATANSYDRYFGIFILPEKETCSFQKAGKCGKTCDKFLDDDITDDLKCLRENILSDPQSPHNDELKVCKTPKMLKEYLAPCGLEGDKDEESNKENELEADDKDEVKNTQQQRGKQRRKGQRTTTTTTTTTTETPSEENESSDDEQTSTRRTTAPTTTRKRRRTRPTTTTSTTTTAAPDEDYEVDEEEEDEVKITPKPTSRSRLKSSRTTKTTRTTTTTEPPEYQDEEEESEEEPAPAPKPTTKRPSKQKDVVEQPSKSRRPSKNSRKPTFTKLPDDNEDEDNEKETNEDQPSPPVTNTRTRKRNESKATRRKTTKAPVDNEYDEDEENDDDIKPRGFQTRQQKQRISNKRQPVEEIHDESSEES